MQTYCIRIDIIFRHALSYLLSHNPKPSMYKLKSSVRSHFCEFQLGVVIWEAQKLSHLAGPNERMSAGRVPSANNSQFAWELMHFQSTPTWPWVKRSGSTWYACQSIAPKWSPCTCTMPAVRDPGVREAPRLLKHLLRKYVIFRHSQSSHLLGAKSSQISRIKAARS